ncbi:hypothetical protein B0T19DRAFT_135045 [Cercophora scortea]|uniref:Uncharacterized protein n=1 Tax=Cercophora scortea TaxID=314031 RepID=A0AAE0IYR5_9PEZI|nr:hypothetical protein B0T19DRAFT_135045 [Cercophora scortea]
MADSSAGGNDTITTAAVSGITSWFPTGQQDLPGWRFDVITLLAVIGESSVAEHAQTITASTLCLLPRIIPAPQALLRPTRPQRLPEVTAKMAGVYGGVVLDSVGFFANIMHPLDELKPFAFQVLEIKHSHLTERIGGEDGAGQTRSGWWWWRWLTKGRRRRRQQHQRDRAISGIGVVHSHSHRNGDGRRTSRIPQPPDTSGNSSSSDININNTTSSSSPTAGRPDSTTLKPPPPPAPGGLPRRANSIAFTSDPERGASHTPRLQPPQPQLHPTQHIKKAPTLSEKFTDVLTNPTMVNSEERYTVPPALYSPIHIINLLSFLLTMSLLALAGVWGDGTAILAIVLISLASSVVGYASWWRPILMNRRTTNVVPRGDVVIRTRAGAFILIRCTEEVARELYSGTEECRYVSTKYHRAFMGLGMLLLMVSVVLLGNCGWNSQVFIGASYILLNGIYWAIGLLPHRHFWDLSRYDCVDVTPEDARRAHEEDVTKGPREGTPSYTRTLWYAIRETEHKAWVERSGASPGTEQWRTWLEEAVQAARERRRDWGAVARKNEIMKVDLDGTSPTTPASSGMWRRGGEKAFDEAEQHAPLVEVQPRSVGQERTGMF